MNTTTPIPVAIYGKDQKVAESVLEKLLPDIESWLPPFAPWELLGCFVHRFAKHGTP